MEVRQLQEILSNTDNCVFFGGAGVSTESGILDFRSADGLYHQTYAYPPEVILSHKFFMENTKEFYEFYKKKILYLDAKPNKAHVKLAELEKSGKLKATISQNIDGLHQMAGSKHVLELHGSVHRNYCMQCHQFYEVESIEKGEGIPKCTCGGIIKPDVVLYGEALDNAIMNNAVKAIARADVLIIGGTSLGVYPAAGLIDYYRGNKLLLINKTPTPMDQQADFIFSGNIGEIFGEVIVD